MSVLTICQDAARELSIASPASIIGNSAEDPALLLRLAKKSLKTVAWRIAWQGLTKEQTFTSVGAETETAALPTDFGRFVNETMWNRTRKRSIAGPINAQEWQQIKAGGLNSINPVFRQRGGSILINQAQTAGDTIAFEYLTKYVAVAVDGTTFKETYTVDTDTPRALDEELLTLDLIWRFRQHKGYEFESAEKDFERFLMDVQMNDGGKPILRPDPMRVRSIKPLFPDITSIVAP